MDHPRTIPAREVVIDDGAAGLRRRLAVLEATTRTQEACIVGLGGEPRETALFEQLLRELITLSGSIYGAIGALSLLDDGSAYNEILATGRVSERGGEASAEVLIEPSRPEAGTLDAVLDAVVMSGGVVTTDGRAGSLLPPREHSDHSRFETFVGVPLLYRGMMVGSVVLADRGEGYDARLLAELAPLLAAGAGILESRRSRGGEPGGGEDDRVVRLANRASSVFLADVTHELRTPLTSIVGFVRTLVRNPAENLEPRQLKLLDRVHDRSLHALSLVEDVLEVCEDDEYDAAPKRSNVDLTALSREVLYEVQGSLNKPLVEVGAELPLVSVMAVTDRARMRQLLVRLLGNAIKSTVEGQVTLRLGLTDDAWASYLEVEDTGAGTPKGAQSEIFPPFQSRDGRRSRRHAGTGVGLTIIQWLVDQLGFELEVDSELGVGSTFRVSLLP